MPYIGTKPENIIATAVDTTTGKFSGEVDAASLDISGNVDIDGILEADAMTLNGTSITGVATLLTGISNGNLPVFTSGVADDDFLRVAGTSVEGRSASEVLSDIGASAVAGSSSIVTTGALNSGSITSGFGAIDTGSSNITSTGVGSFGSLDISGDIDVDGTTNLDVVDIDGAVDMASDLIVAGRVGVGISNPAAYDDGADKLVVGSTSGRSGITIVSSTSNDGSINFADGTSGTARYMGFINYNQSTNTMKLATNAGTRLTIDNNGNVMVGKTSNSHSTVGVGLESSGGGNFVVNGGTTLILNRLSSDGTILDFRKDSTSVGTIGAFGATGVYVSAPTSGGSALVFNSNAPILYPAKNNSGTIAVADNAIDLGASGVRFKDLYLSGGAFLGGTGTANKLDDYEEGTSTISIGSGSSRAGTWSSAIGRYTKVGRKVTLQIDITGSGMYFSSTAGYAVISGVPFDALQGTGTQNYAGSWSGNNVGVSSGGSVYLNNTSIYLHASNSGQSSSGVSGIGVTITYFTA